MFDLQRTEKENLEKICEFAFEFPASNQCLLFKKILICHQHFSKLFIHQKNFNATFAKSVHHLKEQILQANYSALLEAEADEAAAKQNYELAIQKLQESARLARIKIVWDRTHNVPDKFIHPKNQTVLHVVLIVDEERRLRDKIFELKQKIPKATHQVVEEDSKEQGEQAKTLIGQIKDHINKFTIWEETETFDCIFDAFAKLNSQFEEQASQFDPDQQASFLQQCRTLEWKIRRTIENFKMELQMDKGLFWKDQKAQQIKHLVESAPFELERIRLQKKYIDSLIKI